MKILRKDGLVEDVEREEGALKDVAYLLHHLNQAALSFAMHTLNPTLRAQKCLMVQEASPWDVVSPLVLLLKSLHLKSNNGYFSSFSFGYILNLIRRILCISSPQYSKASKVF